MDSIKTNKEIRRIGVAHPMRFEFLYARTPADLLHPVVKVPVGQWIVPAIQEYRVSLLHGRPIFSHVLVRHIPDLVTDIYSMAFLSLSGPLCMLLAHFCSESTNGGKIADKAGPQIQSKGKGL